MVSYGAYQGAVNVGSTAATSYTISGLACGTTYSLSVDAADAAGNRSAKATISGATIVRPDTQAPTPPGSPHSISATGTSVTLAWNASLDNVGVAGYDLYRDGTPLVTLSAATLNYSDTVTAGSTHSYTVDAFDAAGNHSATATPISVTTSTADTTPPTVPTGLTAAVVGSSTVNLAWNASTDNVGVTGYTVYQGASVAGTTGSTTYTVGGLACGTSYSFSVDASDAAGNRSAKATVSASTSACPPVGDTQPPSTPSNLQSTSSTISSVSLAWGASTDNVGVTGYGVYVGGASTGSTASTSFTVSGLVCGTAYSFAVDAVDAAGNRSGKASVSASTAACAGGGGGATANLWVDTNGGSCARQATPGTYVDAQACSSFAAAYTAAQCGDTVDVVAGSYGAQTLSASKSCTPTTAVTFSAQGSVTLTGALTANASYLTFSGSGFNFTKTYSVGQGASYVSFVNVSSPYAFVMGSNVLIKGGQIGPNNTCNTGWEDGLQIWDNGSVSATFVTVDGVTFHDISDNGNECAGFPNAGVHVDCIQMLGASNITIENSTFYNCATSDVIGRPYTTPMHDILIQNNMMAGVVTPGADINIGNSADVCNNVVVQYNTALGAYPSLICGAGGSGNIARGNIFAGYFAQTGFANSYNVTSATSPLGTGSKKCTPAFTNASSTVADYHLSATDTCAKNAGDPANYPATDIDGNPRPAGGAADAGADEVGSITRAAPPGGVARVAARMPRDGGGGVELANHPVSRHSVAPLHGDNSCLMTDPLRGPRSATSRPGAVRRVRTPPDLNGDTMTARSIWARGRMAGIWFALL